MGNGVSSHIDQQKYRNFESDRNLESYDEYVAEIGNEEQLLARLHRFIDHNLQLRDEEVIKEIFTTRCKENNEDGFWSFDTFSRFIKERSKRTNLSDQQANDLYDCIIKLGSYPYISRPAPKLSWNVLKTALLVLTGTLQSTHPIGTSPSFHGAARAKHIRHIFLALSDRTGPGTLLDEPSEDDNEDLIDALSFIDAYRQWEGPNPAVAVPAPALPGPDIFTSSKSKPIGKVSSDKVRLLIKFLLWLKVDYFGLDLGITVWNEWFWSSAVESIISSGRNQEVGPASPIIWTEFDRILQTVPRLFEDLDQGILQYLTRAARAADANERGVLTMPIHGQLLTMSRLSQILSSLYSDTPGRTTSSAISPLDFASCSLQYSGPLQGFHDTIVTLTRSTTRNRSALILISGTSDNEVCGMLIPANTDDFRTTSVFQLLPSNHSFSAYQEPQEAERAEILKATNVKGNISKTTVSDREGKEASLSLDLDQQTVTLSWARNEQSREEQTSQVKWIECIMFG